MRASLKIFGLILLIAAAFFFLSRLIGSRARGLTAPEPLIEPVMQDVSAELGWQSTGILLQAGETIHIHFLSGEIRDGDALVRGPAGAGWACADTSCCEPMPDIDRDALIGRVGDTLFSIGDTSGITVSTSGELQLRINDCDAGLFDNSGRLTIRISP